MDKRKIRGKVSIPCGVIMTCHVTYSSTQKRSYWFWDSAYITIYLPDAKILSISNVSLVHSSE